MEGRRSGTWVALAVGAAIFAVLNAVCSLFAIINQPNFITVTSAFFVVAWYWIAVGAWRESGRRRHRPAEPDTVGAVRDR